MQVALFILGIILFAGLVIIHEFGHYWAARRAGVEVEEFGLGFPPRVWSRKLKSKMLLSINLLPLGGFVKLKGSHDIDDRPGSFGSASLGAKTKILLAGVTMNLLAGIVLLTILAATGLPMIFDKSSSGHDQFTVKSDTRITRDYVYIQDILPGSPADQAGLRDSDIIESISANGQNYKVTSADSLRSNTAKLAGQSATIYFKRSNHQMYATANLLTKSDVSASLNTDHPKGYLGVATTDLLVRRSTWSAPIVAVGLTGQLVELTAQGLWHALSGLGSTIAGGVSGNHVARENGQTEATAQTGGPVAVAAILWDNGSLGLSFVLVVIAVVSLTLALVNALPIPALDGGRLFVIMLSRLWRRRFSADTEDLIHNTGMMVLLFLFAIITIVDVRRFH